MDFHHAGVFIEMRLKVLGSLVVLTRRHQNGVFHRRDNDLGVDALLAAQLIDRLVEQTGCHDINLYPGIALRLQRPS